MVGSPPVGVQAEPADRVVLRRLFGRRNRLWDNLPLHSFQTLLADLGTICVDKIQPLRFGRTELATAAVSVDEFGRGMVLWVGFAPLRRESNSLEPL